MIIVVENTWEGHTPTYFKAITEAFLRSGREVCVACPEPEEVRAEMCTRLRPGVLQRLKLLKLAHFDLGLKKGNRVKAVLNRTRMCAATVRQILAWSASDGRKIDLIFFNLLEPYLNSLGYLYLRSCPVPWTGIYMHPFPRSMRGREESVTYRLRTWALRQAISGANFVRGLTLDEGVCGELRKLTGREFVPFPDITDETDPVEISPLARQIQNWANGRPVIALVGGQTRRKGSLTLLDYATKMTDDNICFVFAGGFHSKDAMAELDEFKRRIRSAQSGHIFTHLSRVADGREFNSLVKVSSAIYCCYENFPHSSNILTKASLFRKPVLVSPHGLMAERVSQFHLGQVVAPEDAPAMVVALRAMVQTDWMSAVPQFETYASLHSQEQLRALLNSLVQPTHRTVQPDGRLTSP